IENYKYGPFGITQIEKDGMRETINYDDFSIGHGYKQADILEIYNYNFSIANEFFEKSMEV
ncbi:MAG: hypothetical protein RR162_05225, partial [Oscillospiraceae bacterium]